MPVKSLKPDRAPDVILYNKGIEVQFWLLSIESMEEFEAQAKDENITTYAPFQLIRMDQRHVHRTALPIENKHSRTFLKISFSKHKYNLKGNSRNSLFMYDWKMHDRQELRNCPINKESDFVKE